MKEKSKVKGKISKSEVIKFIFKKTAITFLALLFILISTSLIAYHLAYLNKIYPGVKVGNLHLGNLTLEEANRLLQSQVSSFQAQSLTLSYNGKNKTLPLSTLEVTYDASATAQLSFNLGRGKNPLLNFEDKWQSFTQGVNFEAIYSLNDEALEKTVRDLAKEVDNPPVDASIKISVEKVEISPAKTGVLLDRSEAKEKIKQAISSLSSTAVSLSVRPANPITTEDNALKAREETEKILSHPLTLRYQDKAWALGKEQLSSFLSFSTQKEEITPAFRFSIGGKNFEIKSIYAADSRGGGDVKAILKVNLNQEKIKETVSNIAKEINQEPVDAKFKFENGKVTVFVPHKVGRELDETAAVEKITTTLEDGQEEVDLPVNIKNPTVTNENVSNFNIKELLGRGTSKFAHSIPSRVYNVGLAASRINGALIAPGETFSMYKTIGEVDGSTGYQEAYVISNGRTKLDYGGGVCQVSTTLFRAVLNSGLPVVERYPHAYRVGYYEQDMSPGVDASVFFPSSDFKFKNDTPGYILIQAIPDLANYSLTFEIYGTFDGRKSEVGNFWLGNQVPPPPALYQDDPTLPKGTTKQIDWAAWGADASFTRAVTRNGEVIISDKFFSRYKAWQAVYLVGTKE
ncbi:MAG: VanW family protein [Patescibacteria group bacterium]|nr:VanW family protein [Patescibacteria group bacterium]